MFRTIAVYMIYCEEGHSLQYFAKQDQIEYFCNLETPFLAPLCTERIHDYRGCEAGHEIMKAGAAQFTDPISDTRNNREGALANE